MRMHKPDLMEIKNEKAREEKIATSGVEGVEASAKMEDEELEDKEGAKRAAAVSASDPIANDMECRVEQEMIIGDKEEADVGEYFW
jgi:hypothetical protein